MIIGMGCFSGGVVEVAWGQVKIPFGGSSPDFVWPNWAVLFGGGGRMISCTSVVSTGVLVVDIQWALSQSNI